MNQTFGSDGGRPQLKIAACAPGTICFAGTGTQGSCYGSLPLNGPTNLVPFQALSVEALTAEPGTAYLVASDAGAMFIGKFPPGGNATFSSAGAQPFTAVSATPVSGNQLGVVGVNPGNVVWRVFNRSTLTQTGMNSVSNSDPVVGTAFPSPTDSGFLYAAAAAGSGNAARLEHAELTSVGTSNYAPTGAPPAGQKPRVFGGQNAASVWLMWETNSGSVLYLFDVASRSVIGQVNVANSSNPVGGLAVIGGYAYVLVDYPNSTVTFGESGNQIVVMGGPGTALARFSFDGGPDLRLDYASRLSGANKRVTEVVGLFGTDGGHVIGLAGLCKGTGAVTGDCPNGSGEGVVGIFAPP